MKGTILYIIALVLIFILYPLGYLICFFLAGFKKWGRYNEDVAIGIDVLGNIFLSPLFNKILIAKDGYRFGNRKETISSVLGKNQNSNTLLRTGKFLVNILDKIEKDHCFKSIDRNP